MPYDTCVKPILLMSAEYLKITILTRDTNKSQCDRLRLLLRYENLEDLLKFFLFFILF